MPDDSDRVLSLYTRLYAQHFLARASKFLLNIWALVYFSNLYLQLSCVNASALGLAYRRPGSSPRRMVVVRAEAINPDIRKTEEKVVDSVVVTDLAKPLTPYCRCWRSATFPLCDGSHVKHNKATGDNVGPLLLKKQ